jgi:nucleotide-binding universal stress UspA family protein
MIRTILLPLADGLAAEPLLEAALLLGRRLGARIRVVYLRPDPDSAVSGTAGVFRALGLTRSALEAEIERAAAGAKAKFHEWQAVHGVAAERSGPDDCYATWSELVGDIEVGVTRFGRVSDLIVVDRPTPRNAQAQRSFDAAVFGSGRPVLVVCGRLPADFADHVMIAWNGSLGASRAVAAAMPLLRLAKRVSICTALEFGADAVDLMDLGEALAEHGVRTPEVFFPDEQTFAGGALLAAAERQGASLIVMGAYTHGRLRQDLLGGVTRHLLAQAPVPLLMSH